MIMSLSQVTPHLPQMTLLHQDIRIVGLTKKEKMCMLYSQAESSKEQAHII